MNYELPSIELRVIEENNYLKFGEYLNDMPCGNIINKLSLDDLEYVKKLQQENKQQKEVIDKAIEYIRNHQLVFKDATLEETEEWFNQFYIDVLDILKEV